MGNRIYIEPIKPIIKKLDKQKEKDILLMGSEGVGKTEVLNEYVKHNNEDHLIVNGTIRPEEMILITDLEIANLYHVGLLISKMINKINSDYRSASDDFYKLESLVCNILRSINGMYMIGDYKKKSSISKDLINEPEILLETFLELVVTNIGITDVTVILDDFDVVGFGNAPSARYQKYMYNLLKEYTRLILTISDDNVLSSENEKNRLSNTNILLEVNYSKKVDVVKEIIDSSLAVGRFKNERIGLLLSNETIMLMIEKTKGNLFDILRVVREFYRNINTLNKAEYDTFVLDYIDNVINRSPIYTGHVKRERKLSI